MQKPQNAREMIPQNLTPGQRRRNVCHSGSGLQPCTLLLTVFFRGPVTGASRACISSLSPSSWEAQACPLSCPLRSQGPMQASVGLRNHAASGRWTGDSVQGLAGPR